MRQSPASATFALRRYRTQWSHLPLVLLPFLGAMGAAILLYALEPALGERVGTALLSVVGVAFAAFVLMLPRIWRRWRDRGGVDLVLGGGRLRLVDPATGRSLGACPASTERLIAGEYRFTVNQRFAGGTYRAPALILRLDGGASIAVGAVGSRLAWREVAAPVRRPQYELGAAEWETLIEALGLAERLAPVADARVG